MIFELPQFVLSVQIGAVQILGVDWSLNKEFILEGNDYVRLNKNWNGNIPDIIATVNVMERAVEIFDLETNISICFADDISDDDYNILCRLCNLVPYKPVKWRNRGDECLIFDIKKLPK